MAISLVYAGTRHERMEQIVRRALRVGLTISIVMAVIFVLLLWLTWNL